MKRIYVVEYSALARQRIREALAGVGDCEIVGEAEAASEGVSEINDLEPDVVITDLLLRNGTGIDVVRRLRARHGRGRPVIYVLTNRPSLAHRARLAAAGADGVFDKARDYDRMIDEVRHVA